MNHKNEGEEELSNEGGKFHTQKTTFIPCRVLLPLKQGVRDWQDHDRL